MRIVRSEFQNFRALLSITVLALVCLPFDVSAQVRTSSSPPNIQDPDALVRDVIHNEMEAQSRDQSLWCYREQRQEDGKPAKTLQVCQTKDGELERLIA